MGWFSSVCSFIGGAISKVWSVGSSIISSVGSKISEWLGFAKELKDAPKYDERNATMDETIKMSELLDRQRTGFSNTISDLEKDFTKKAEKTFNDLLIRSKEINVEYGTSIHISFLKNQFDNYIDKMQGSLSNKVNQRIQISDAECSSLLKLEGSERESKIDLYIKRIIKEGMEKYISELDQELRKTLDLFEHAIQEKLKQKEKEAGYLLSEIDNAKFIEDVEEKEEKRKELSVRDQDIEKNINLFEKKLELIKN